MEMKTWNWITVRKNLHWKLGQQVPFFGSILENNHSKKNIFLAVVNIKSKKLCLLAQFSGKVLAVSCWLVYGSEANSLFFIVVVLRIWPLLLLSYVHHNGVALFLEYNSFPDYRIWNVHQVNRSFFNNVRSPMLLF